MSTEKKYPAICSFQGVDVTLHAINNTKTLPYGMQYVISFTTPRNGMIGCPISERTFRDLHYRLSSVVPDVLLGSDEGSVYEFPSKESK